MLAKYPAGEPRRGASDGGEPCQGHDRASYFQGYHRLFRRGRPVRLQRTKVFPARLYGNKEKTGAEIEIFLLRELNRELRLWDVLVDPARKIRIGNKLYFGDDDLLVAR